MLALLIFTWPAQTLATADPAPQLAPFTSDGCSRFPDGTPDQPALWLDCCVAHDLAYWHGGSYAERKAADTELYRCVEERAGMALAGVMFSGVRIGGSPYWPTSFRWGFGWNYPRRYAPLSVDEQRLVEERLTQFRRGRAREDRPVEDAVTGRTQ